MSSSLLDRACELGEQGDVSYILIKSKLIKEFGELKWQKHKEKIMKILSIRGK